MISIAVTIGDVTTELETDNVLSFDAIESLLSRAVQSTLAAYSAMPDDKDDDDEDIIDKENDL
jgi:hypothetical protein